VVGEVVFETLSSPTLLVCTRFAQEQVLSSTEGIIGAKLLWVTDRYLLDPRVHQHPPCALIHTAVPMNKVCL
jgi:hypothetical protein